MKILSYEPDRKVCDETDVDSAKLRLPPDRFDNATTTEVAEKYSSVGSLPPKRWLQIFDCRSTAIIETAENRELQQT